MPPKNKKHSKSGEEEAALDDEKFCYCQKPDNGTPMICCDGCQLWYHKACIGLAGIAPHVGDFFCPSCIAQPRLLAKHIDLFRNLESTVVDIQREVGILKVHDAEHINNVRRLTTRIDGHDKALQGVESDIRFMADKNQALTVDVEERRRRERHIIIRNIPEGSDEKQTVAAMCRYMGVEARIVRVDRLGTMETVGRIRPVRVMFEQPFTVEGLLAAAPRLKSSPWPRMFINRDLTTMQQTDLEKELRDRFDKGENVTIVGTRVRPWRGDQLNPRQTRYFEDIERERLASNVVRDTTNNNAATQQNPITVGPTAGNGANSSCLNPNQQGPLPNPTTSRGPGVPPDPIVVTRPSAETNKTRRGRGGGFGSREGSRPVAFDGVPGGAYSTHPSTVDTRIARERNSIIPAIHNQNRGLHDLGHSTNYVKTRTSVPQRESRPPTRQDTPAFAIHTNVGGTSQKPQSLDFDNIVESLSPKDMQTLINRAAKMLRNNESADNNPTTQNKGATVAAKPPRPPVQLRSETPVRASSKHKASPPNQESDRKRHQNNTSSVREMVNSDSSNESANDDDDDDVDNVDIRTC